MFAPLSIVLTCSQPQPGAHTWWFQPGSAVLEFSCCKYCWYQCVSRTCCFAVVCTLVLTQVPVEVTDAEEEEESQGPKHLPHRYQLAGGRTKSSADGASSRNKPTTGSSTGRQASRYHSTRRTADDRR